MPSLKSLTGGGAVLAAKGYDITKPLSVSRTGYNEIDIVDPNTINLKLGGALHYKFTNNVEGSLTAYWGTGNTVYTGASRYSIKNFKMGQYKLELNGKNWMLRGYTTQVILTMLGLLPSYSMKHGNLLQPGINSIFSPIFLRFFRMYRI
jgi:hypothetical protein